MEKTTDFHLHLEKRHGSVAGAASGGESTKARMNGDADIAVAHDSSYLEYIMCLYIYIM